MLKCCYMDYTQIITTSITAVASSVVALFSVYMNSQRKKDKEEMQWIAKKESAKGNIQNLITQDIIRVEILKKEAENYQAILHEYDDYVKSGGNSYVKEKVHDYIEWHAQHHNKKLKK